MPTCLGTRAVDVSCFPPCPLRPFRDANGSQFLPSQRGNVPPGDQSIPCRIARRDKNKCVRTDGRRYPAMYPRPWRTRGTRTQAVAPARREEREPIRFPEQCSARNGPPKQKSDEPDPSAWVASVSARHIQEKCE